MKGYGNFLHIYVVLENTYWWEWEQKKPEIMDCSFSLTTHMRVQALSLKQSSRYVTRMAEM